MSETPRGKIIMSCGCEETDERQGEYVTYGSYDTFSDGSYGRCVAYAHMCQMCVDGFKASGIPFFSTETEADLWLASPTAPKEDDNV